MVWAGIIDEKLIGPFFFDGNVNGESYLNMLQEFLIPQLASMGMNPREIWFQQDGAPSHRTRAVKEFLNDTFYGWIGNGGTVDWPARSPDFNPCDIFLWGALKAKVYLTPSNGIDELRAKVRHEIQNISSEAIRNVYGNFCRRLEKCLNINGTHVEVGRI